MHSAQSVIQMVFALCSLSVGDHGMDRTLHCIAECSRRNCIFDPLLMQFVRQLLADDVMFYMLYEFGLQAVLQIQTCQIKNPTAAEVLNT